MKKIGVVVVLLFSVLSCEETIFVEDITEFPMQILAPTDGAIIEAGSVNFNWEQVGDVSSYQLQIASPNFSNSTQLLQDTILNATFFNTDLIANRYQWRVRGINSAYETAYSTQNFEIVSLNVNDEVQLISPANELISDQVNHLLKWNEVDFAERYTVQIWSPNSAGTLTQEIEIDTTAVTVTFEEGAFIWQVNAINGAKSTSYSSRSILIDATAPNLPVLQTPENEFQLINNNVQFSWQREIIDGSAEYDSIFVYRDIDLTQLETKEKVTTKEIKLELNPNEYYWAVRSYDGAGNLSELSAIATFKILEEISEEEIELLTPLDQIIINSDSQVYSWDPIESASKYKLQILKNDGSNSIVSEFISDETEKEVSLHDGNYIWQVKGENDFGETAYSKRTILVDTRKPNTATLIAPENTHSQLENIVRFDYDRMPLEGSGEIDSLFVFADENLSEVVLQSEITSNYYGEFGDGNYFWYLKSYDLAGNESAQSDIWSFTIEKDFSEEIVELLTPSEEFVTNIGQQTFEWTALENAIDYHIIIHKKGDDSTVFLDFTLPITTKTFTLDDGNYTWKVRAQNGNQNTQYTESNLLIDTTVPEKATLLTPTNAAVSNNSTVEFSWSIPLNAGSDEISTINIYSDVDLENLLYSEEINGNYLFKDMVAGTYYWHITVADKAGNIGEQSEVYTFTIE